MAAALQLVNSHVDEATPAGSVDRRPRGTHASFPAKRLSFQ
jgi:hypothetical protein